jgi:hypothetical protein
MGIAFFGMFYKVTAVLMLTITADFTACLQKSLHLGLLGAENMRLSTVNAALCIKVARFVG